MLVGICMPVISTNTAGLQALVFNNRPGKSCIPSRERTHAVLCSPDVT